MDMRTDEEVREEPFCKARGIKRASWSIEPDSGGRQGRGGGSLGLFRRRCASGGLF